MKFDVTQIVDPLVITTGGFVNIVVGVIMLIVIVICVLGDNGDWS